MKILIINAGSSSLKYQFMDSVSGEVYAKGLCERITLDGRLTHKVPGRENVVEDIPMPTHAEAMTAVMDILVDPVHGVIASTDEIDAVGHRVLHGGMEFTASVLASPRKVMRRHRAHVSRWAPLHNPANLMGIRACQKVMPDVPQVAVFDTAFHHDHAPQGIYLRPAL